MINHGMFTSEKETWGTPHAVFDALNKEFNFTIDLCADSYNYKMKPYYTEIQNSLSLSWDNERGYCNPPYGREIKHWVKKAYESKGLIVMLIPSRTDTEYWHDYVMKAKEIRFIRGRLKFENDDRVGTQPAPFPSAIVVFDGQAHDIPIIKSVKY